MDKEALSYTDLQGRKVYALAETVLAANKGLCPICRRSSNFQDYHVRVYDFASDALLDIEHEYYCGYGCELENMTPLSKANYDYEGLKQSVMALRAVHSNNSIKLCLNEESAYLHGYNCLYVHYMPIAEGYAVYRNYWLEYAYEGRNPEVDFSDMLIQKKRPNSKDAKQWLYEWLEKRVREDVDQ